jgi:hypothetical protein
MSVPNDPPLTRREARRLQRQAEEAVAAPAEPVSVGSPATGAASVVSGASATEPPAAAWVATPGSFRRRDFAPSAPAHDASSHSFASERPDEPLEYRTHGRAASPPPELIEPREPAPAPLSTSAAQSDRPLSRRELRALAVEQQADVPSGGDEQPAVETAGDGEEGVPRATIVATATTDTSQSAASAPDVLPGVAAAPHAPRVSSHWSVGVHDDEDPFENTFSRQVGSAATSANALVLPEMPRGDLAGPVAGAGEIIITGMIEVPSSVASTGAVPSVHDSHDLDDLFGVDTEYAPTDSAPVSAISAVSSHTGTSDVMGGRKARRTSVLTTALVGSTVVMAVVAVALFVVAAVNGLF